MTDRSGPTSEQLAAILAAVEMAWPRPAVAGGDEADPPRWRFSGRWWSRPIPARRERPW
jgi:hypothetical protein